MLYDDREHVSLLSYPKIRNRPIVLNGWSKTYAMTGWRLGFAVWPDKLVEPITRLSVIGHFCVSAPTQLAGIAALEGPQEPVRDVVTRFDERWTFIVKALNDLPGMRCADAGGAF